MTPGESQRRTDLPPARGVRGRIHDLLGRMSEVPLYPSQGRTVFVDMEREDVRWAYTPLEVVRALLEGRGASMWYLWNLLDEGLAPLDPETPIIFSAGMLTGLVPSAARGNVTSWSPETRVLMDSNVGDYFPSFLKLNGIDRLVIHGRDDSWKLIHVDADGIHFHDASAYLGLDNLDMRQTVERDFGGRWARNLAMVNITRAGENGCLNAGIMGGPKAIFARGGTAAKMASHRLKAIVLEGFDASAVETFRPKEVKPFNREIARTLLGTGVVKKALKIRGTPFLYKPSRLLSAMGTKNNQVTTWTADLDAENLDPWRPGMAGCFRCPVNCRPLNDLGGDGRGDRYDAGDGPEYVTLGKFGPNIGVEDPKAVLRLNNICNDLGFDTASTGSSIGWAMELYQRGVITKEDTGGIELRWGDDATIERLLFLTAVREGFGDVLACSAAAVREGRYPEEALEYRMAVKGLFQSDPHDARILKAFALGLAVATRGMDHLRNRVTLEINASINDDPEYKKSLYGGTVAAEPNLYGGKEIAVRRCENVFGVGDAIGMCRFTTKLFNSPNLPGYEEFAPQIENVTGLRFSTAELDEVGHNINGAERMINERLGTGRADDTLPDRWFEVPIEGGPFAGEKIDRARFDAMLSRFYRLSELDEEGHPAGAFRRRLEDVLVG